MGVVVGWGYYPNPYSINPPNPNPTPLPKPQELNPISFSLLHCSHRFYPFKV
jgi:hypothetical protein